MRKLTHVHSAPDSTMMPLTNHVGMASKAMMASILNEALDNLETEGKR
jgi:hypothetical protein